jgi:hypothetical protein
VLRWLPLAVSLRFEAVDANQRSQYRRHFDLHGQGGGRVITCAVPGFSLGASVSVTIGDRG